MQIMHSRPHRLSLVCVCVYVRVCVCVCTPYAQVESGEHLSLADRLCNVGVTYIGHLFLRCPTDCTDKAKALRASLTVARALTCPADKVCLSGWTVTPALVSELRGLPEWHSTLKLQLQSGPEPDVESVQGMASVPVYVPSTYRTWDVSHCQCSHKTICALVAAAPRDRTADTPLKIQLPHGHTHMWVADVQALFAEYGACPHVTVG